MENKSSRPQRHIFHCDMNAYFASVEELFHPELKKAPMAVCGNPESRRGIILAKNELAKGFGVKTAETIWQARQKCPNLVLTSPRRDEYSKYCALVNTTIYEQYTDLVEHAGIDESYLDVTGSLHLFGGDPVALAHQIRERVWRETKLTISVGVSYNKIFAKLGSDLKKPNAVSCITPENYRDAVWPLPVCAMMFVGRATEQTLDRLYIKTIGDLAKCDPATLTRHLGKMGEQLHIYANGLDDNPVLSGAEVPDVQSVGNGMTFKRNLVSREDIRVGVAALADTVAARMRRLDVKCLTVQVTIKDVNLKVITRQRALDSPTWLAKDIARTAMEIVEGAWKIGIPIRLLTITASRLLPSDSAGEQLSIFGGQDDPEQKEKQERLEKTVDRLRNRYGGESVTRGSILHNDLGIHERYGNEDEE